MSLSFDTTAKAAIASGAYGVAWLIELRFASGTVYATTWPVDVAASDGHTYTALGNLVAVNDLTESGDTTSEKIGISLSLVSATMLGYAAGSPSQYRGKRALISLQLFDAAHNLAGVMVPRWSGYMDRVKITRSPSGGDGASGKIVMECSRAGLARARVNQGRRLNDLQQQAKYPGDTGLRMVNNLIEFPTAWLSVAFQRIP